MRENKLIIRQYTLHSRGVETLHWKHATTKYSQKSRLEYNSKKVYENETHTKTSKHYYRAVGSKGFAPCRPGRGVEETKETLLSNSRLMRTTKPDSTSWAWWRTLGDSNTWETGGKIRRLRPVWAIQTNQPNNQTTTPTLYANFSS